MRPGSCGSCAASAVTGARRGPGAGLWGSWPATGAAGHCRRSLPRPATVLCRTRPLTTAPSPLCDALQRGDGTGAA